MRITVYHRLRAHPRCSSVLTGVCGTQAPGRPPKNSGREIFILRSRWHTCPPLSIDRSLLLRAPPEEQQMWGTVWVIKGSENVNGICCIFGSVFFFLLFCPFWPIWGWGNVTTELQWREQLWCRVCRRKGRFFLGCTHPHTSSLPFTQLINCGEYPFACTIWLIYFSPSR